MKKITLIVPDTITRTIITAKDSYTEEIELNERTFIRALINNEYGITYRFAEGSVKVESIKSTFNA